VRLVAFMSSAAADAGLLQQRSKCSSSSSSSSNASSSISSSTNDSERTNRALASSLQNVWLTKLAMFAVNQWCHRFVSDETFAFATMFFDQAMHFTFVLARQPLRDAATNLARFGKHDAQPVTASPSSSLSSPTGAASSGAAAAEAAVAAMRSSIVRLWMAFAWAAVAAISFKLSGFTFNTTSSSGHLLAFAIYSFSFAFELAAEPLHVRLYNASMLAECEVAERNGGVSRAIVTMLLLLLLPTHLDLCAFAGGQAAYALVWTTCLLWQQQQQQQKQQQQQQQQHPSRDIIKAIHLDAFHRFFKTFIEQTVARLPELIIMACAGVGASTAAYSLICVQLMGLVPRLFFSSIEKVASAAFRRSHPPPSTTLAQFSPLSCTIALFICAFSISAAPAIVSLLRPGWEGDEKVSSVLLMRVACARLLLLAANGVGEGLVEVVCVGTDKVKRRTLIVTCMFALETVCVLLMIACVPGWGIEVIVVASSCISYLMRIACNTIVFIAPALHMQPAACLALSLPRPHTALAVAFAAAAAATTASAAARILAPSSLKGNLCLLAINAAFAAAGMRARVRVPSFAPVTPPPPPTQPCCT